MTILLKIGEQIDEFKFYRYLGINENGKGIKNFEMKISIRNEVFRRIEILCKTRLNSIKIFKAVNEYA